MAKRVRATDLGRLDEGTRTTKRTVSDQHYHSFACVATKPIAITLRSSFNVPDWKSAGLLCMYIVIGIYTYNYVVGGYFKYGSVLITKTFVQILNIKR